MNICWYFSCVRETIVMWDILSYIYLLIVSKWLDCWITRNQHRFSLLDGPVQVPQVTPFWLPKQTWKVNPMIFRCRKLSGNISQQTTGIHVHKRWQSLRTKFVNRGIIVIAGCDKRATGCAPKVRSSMVLHQIQNMQMWSPQLELHSLQRQYWCDHHGFLSSYHVIVHERPSLLNEPCHGKGKVLHRPVRHSTSKLGKPWHGNNVKIRQFWIIEMPSHDWSDSGINWVSSVKRSTIQSTPRSTW